MNLINLVMKPSIAKDSFKPKILHKIYGKIVILPACIVHVAYAAFKYDGDMLRDNTIRDIVIDMWYSGDERMKNDVIRIFRENDKLKELFSKAKSEIK